MGGDFMTSHYVYPKTSTFFRGSYRIPGYPANPRMLLVRLYLQLGIYLDYYAGQHEPSLSVKLREALLSFDQDTGSNDRLEAVTTMLDSVPEHHLALFPQSIVPQKESRNLHQLILASSSPPTFTEGAPEEDITQHASKGSKLIEVPGAEHSFDLVPDAEEKYGKVFNEIVEYLDGVEVTQKIFLFQNGCFERPWKRNGMAGPSIDSYGCHIMLLERINPPTPTYFSSDSILAKMSAQVNVVTGDV
ncbi:hypothetical protein EST38_g1750 [Candolleomyces aberdarensis]|uniref:Uncharacterized protein n=1 Tax=Candolleomyces aberdarensis TaxID=2316362 RepID=A0A4Q2DX91_9AGAR|nr:hypothetical protein EST38_g1750 [Candolleomyces aberdarensis]